MLSNSVGVHSDHTMRAALPGMLRQYMGHARAGLCEESATPPQRCVQRHTVSRLLAVLAGSCFISVRAGAV